ncbi:MAG: OsmC family peroxiredoxin, partial [Chloroflexota bacterium]
ARVRATMSNPPNVKEMDMAQVRQAQAHWSGDLLAGGGRVTAATSKIFSDQAITWRARTESSEGKTSPEELLAAAHASCYAMAVSHELAQAGHAPDRVDVNVEVRADKTDSGWTVLASHITLRAVVPGIDAATFAEKAEAAKGGCPISKALSGSVEISLDAALEG